MSKQPVSKEIQLTLPAERDFLLVARMALSGLGMLAGLDIEMIGDLRTVADESFDCLLHQAMRPASLRLCARVEGKRLFCRFEAVERLIKQEELPLDLDITRGVLETLMPEVSLLTDESGVSAIECSMPV